MHCRPRRVDQRVDGAAGRVGQLSFRASAVLYSPTTGPRYRFGATERVTARPGSCEQIKAERGRTKATQFLTMTTLGAAIALLAVLSAAPTPTVGQETLCGGSSCESCTWMYNSPCPGGGTCPEGGCAEAVELLQCAGANCISGAVNIPSTFTTVGMGAFYQNTELTSLTWAASVTTIDKGAFSGCSNLQHVNLGDSSVVTIKREAL
jgi:hypothetical protein